MDVRNPTNTDCPGIDLLNAVDRYMVETVQSMDKSPARDAALYHLQTGGQRMRAKLAMASASLQLDPNEAIAAAAACELLHNASLIHDDISDRDSYRRGHETVRARFGDDVALCAGDLLMALSFSTAATLGNQRLATQFVAAMGNCAARVIGGQSVELSGQTGIEVQTFSAYLHATKAKTAPLIELAISVGLEGPDRGLAGRLGESIGLAYQILDDLDDLGCVGEQTPQRLSLHALHAAFHHRSHQRCLQHAKAALTRAAGDAEQLPEPLFDAITGLLNRLNNKAAKYSTIPTAAPVRV